MGNSNIKALRRKYAMLIKDEIFTLNTEIDNTVSRIKIIDYKALKHLSYSRLKGIRDNLQSLNNLIRNLNVKIDVLQSGQAVWGETAMKDDNEDKVVVPINELNTAIRKDWEEEHKITGEITDLTGSQEEVENTNPIPGDIIGRAFQMRPGVEETLRVIGKLIGDKHE